MKERKRRVFVVLVVFIAVLGGYFFEASQVDQNIAPPTQQPTSQVLSDQSSGVIDETKRAADVLEELAVKGRAPKTGYKRDQFGSGWANAGMCDVRNKILQRDLTDIVSVSENDCTVLSGVLDDPYTGKKISFQRGKNTSSDVQIDHVVALSDAWQKGAQQLEFDQRVRFANDGLNLLAVEGKSNIQKSDSDAASWLPSNKPYRCQFVARQIAIKHKYELWITPAEKNAMQRVLGSCPDQRLPAVI